MFFKKDISQKVKEKMLKEKTELFEKYKLIEGYLVFRMNEENPKNKKKKEELRRELREAQESEDELKIIIEFLKK